MLASIRIPTRSASARGLAGSVPATHTAPVGDLAAALRLPQKGIVTSAATERALCPPGRPHATRCGEEGRQDLQDPLALQLRGPERVPARLSYWPGGLLLSLLAGVKPNAT